MDATRVPCPKCFAPGDGTPCNIRSDLRRFSTTHKARRERAEQVARDEREARR
jgi:hypothetical protein